MIDPQAKLILEATNAAPPLNTLGVEEARRRLEARPRLVTTPVGEVTDLAVGKSAVRGRLYHPTPGAIAPVVVFAHGGGWAVGSINTADETCRRLCVASGCAVLSIDYRLAPEHPHPAAVVDMIDAVEWLPAVADQMHLDAGRIALSGESSGAHVAVAAAIALRDAGAAGVAAQFLVCPPLDRHQSTGSWTAMSEGYIPSRQQMAWFWDLYLGAGDEHASGAPDPSKSPLEGLPPTIVVVAQYDPLRDEALEFAERLRGEGVAVEVVDCLGQLHPVFGHASVVAESARYLELCARMLGDLLRDRN